MPQKSDITVSPVAIAQGRACGFTGDIEARIRGLAVAAVSASHEVGNATFGPFVLLIRGTHVAALTMIGPRHVDERPVAHCQLCRGLTIITAKTTMGGLEGLVSRPCPRAFDPTAPLCDTLKRTIP